MNDLTRWLTAMYRDSKLKMSFQTLPIEKYRDEWENIYPYCDKVEVPVFFSKNVDLGEMEQNLMSTYVEVVIENAGYKQQHEYLLTSVTKNYANPEKVMLAFTSKFTYWGSKRLVIVSENAERVYRNDFKDIYKISWKDYSEGAYQKQKKASSAPHIMKLRRPQVKTLTETK